MASTEFEIYDGRSLVRRDYQALSACDRSKRRTVDASEQGAGLHLWQHYLWYKVPRTAHRISRPYVRHSITIPDVVSCSTLHKTA
jgi:hypothetical protein